MMEVSGVPWDAEPWLPYRAAALLRGLKPGVAWEWGSGGSTVILAYRKWQVTSVDHNQAWHEAVKKELARRGLKADLRWEPYEPGEIGPDKADPAHYKSGSTELGAVNFRRYASAIDDAGWFDLIIVDGMARASCLAHAAAHVKPGGALVLDNTGDRPYYLEKTLPLFEGWERIDFTGYGPILAYTWTCTVFCNTRLNDWRPE